MQMDIPWRRPWTAITSRAFTEISGHLCGISRFLTKAFTHERLTGAKAAPMAAERADN